MVSMTAWVGLTEPEVGDVKPDDVVVVSGAAGATVRSLLLSYSYGMRSSSLPLTLLSLTS